MVQGVFKMCSVLALGFCLAARAELQLGSDVLAAGGFQALRGKRVGLITNPSGANRDGRTTIDLLRHAPGVELAALFGPEHGVRGTAAAGDSVAGGVDSGTGLPVHSLYGDTRKPTRQMLQGLDALVYDLQDLGVRSYTYVSTLGLAMEACAEAGVEFVVLDRPNPLGGDRVEGPLLEPEFRSFISQWNIPYVYGLTCGELARMIQGERWIARPCRLTVVPMAGWHRTMVWADTGLKWVPTSPNVPTAEAARGYGALGLIGEMAGGSGLSIGGLFQRPFQRVAATWLDADRLIAYWKRQGPKGVALDPFATSREGKAFRGVDLRFTDSVHSPIVAVNFYILEGVRKATGRDLLAEAEKAGRNLAMFDRAVGTAEVRRSLRAGRSAAALVRSWKAGEDAFRRRRQPYLLYPEKAPAPAPAPAPKRGQYLTVTVERGDTASRIARELHVSVSALAEANPGVDLGRLKPGQKLRVPRQ